MSMSQVKVGGCLFCKETGELCIEKDVEHLQPQVAKVFLCLVEHKDEIVTRDELLDAAWHDQVISDESLTRCISVIRKTLSKHECGIRVDTLHKRGYRLSTKKDDWHIANLIPYSLIAVSILLLIAGLSA